MRPIKFPKIGQYVLVTHWRVTDINNIDKDPWRIDFIREIIVSRMGIRYKVDGDERLWRHCYKITEEEGGNFIRNFIAKHEKQESE